MVFRLVGLTVYWTVVQCLVLEKWVLSLQLKPKESPPLPPPRPKKRVRIVEPHENGGDLNLTDWTSQGESAIPEEKSEGNDFVIINENQKGDGDNLHKTGQSTTIANYAESWTRCKNWFQNFYQRSMECMRQLTPSQTEEQQFVPEAVDGNGEGDAVEMEEGTIPKAYRNVAIVLLSLVLIFPILIDVYHTALRFLHGGGPSSGFPSIVWRYLKTWMPSK